MLQALIGPVAGLLDKVVPDKDVAAKLAHEIATMSETRTRTLNCAAGSKQRGSQGKLVSIFLEASSCMGLRNRHGN